MFCTKCGTSIKDKAIACPKCGAPVKDEKVDSIVQVESHMLGAILTTLFCCLPGGIVAIIFASQVNAKLAQGDIVGSQTASNAALTSIIVSICLAAANVLGYLLFAGVATTHALH